MFQWSASWRRFSSLPYRSCSWGIGGALCLICTAAYAGPILTYDFTGTVSFVNDDTNFNLNGTIPIGTGATGSVTYEAGVAGSAISADGTQYPETSIAFSVNIGSGALVWNSGPLNFFSPSVFVFDNEPGDGDSFEVSGGEAPATGLTLPAGATTSTPFALVGDLQLLDKTATALTGQDIPDPLDPSKFPLKAFFLSGGHPQGEALADGFIAITLDSLTLAPEPSSVPEPASIVGFGLGALVLLGASRRKKRLPPC